MDSFFCLQKSEIIGSNEHARMPAAYRNHLMHHWSVLKPMLSKIMIWRLSLLHLIFVKELERNGYENLSYRSAKSLKRLQNDPIKNYVFTTKDDHTKIDSYSWQRRPGNKRKLCEASWVIHWVRPASCSVRWTMQITKAHAPLCDCQTFIQKQAIHYNTKQAWPLQDLRLWFRIRNCFDYGPGSNIIIFHTSKYDRWGQHCIPL